jgi:hypothetical protein
MEVHTTQNAAERDASERATLCLQYEEEAQTASLRAFEKLSLHHTPETIGQLALDYAAAHNLWCVLFARRMVADKQEAPKPPVCWPTTSWPIDSERALARDSATR